MERAFGADAERSRFYWRSGIITNISKVVDFRRRLFGPGFSPDIERLTLEVGTPDLNSSSPKAIGFWYKFFELPACVPRRWPRLQKKTAGIAPGGLDF
jgi:hypothetical protein